MTKNPLINGLAAGGYVALVTGVLSWGAQLKVGHDNSFLAPMAMISLFTLSAAVMGYIFCYQPIQLYFEGKKKQAVELFLKTTGVFAVLTGIFLVLLFSGVIA